jgi:hypothetical protein
MGACCCETRFMTDFSVLGACEIAVFRLVVVPPRMVDGVRMDDTKGFKNNRSKQIIFQYYSQTAFDCEDSATKLARCLEGSEIKKVLKLSPRVAGSVFGCSRQILNFGSTYGHLCGDECPIHDVLKAFSTWMLSTTAIVVIDRLATKYPRFYEWLLATLDISVQAYTASCAGTGQTDEIEGALLTFDGIK